MPGQRSDWRERLNGNPSRMEQELATKLRDNPIRYLTQVETPVPAVLRRETSTHTYFSTCLIASGISTGTINNPVRISLLVEQILPLTQTVRRFLGDFLGTLRGSPAAASSAVSPSCDLEGIAEGLRSG